MSSFDVFRCENRASGHMEYMGQVESNNKYEAIVIVQKTFECLNTEHFIICDPKKEYVY